MDQRHEGLPEASPHLEPSRLERYPERNMEAAGRGSIGMVSEQAGERGKIGDRHVRGRSFGLKGKESKRERCQARCIDAQVNTIFPNVRPCKPCLDS